MIQSFSDTNCYAPLGIVLDINFLKFPFPGFWFIDGASNALKLEKENICIDNFPDFNVKSSSIENIMKNLTDSRKTMETGVNPRLIMEDIR